MTENFSQQSNINRKKLRQSLLDRRLNNPAADQVISQHLAILLAQLTPQCIGLYWPIRGEVDIRSCVIEWTNAHPDTTMALPYAQQKKGALQFLLWKPNDEMTTDIYGIPTPKNTSPVTPDLLLLPCVGFSHTNDGKYYRLGYGAGSYDRTLAQHPIPCVGIAYDNCYIKDFSPQSHDHHMSYMMTETGCVKSTA